MKAVSLDERLDDRLSDAERRFAGVEEALTSPEVLSNPDRLRELGKERSDLEPLVVAGRALRSALAEHEGAVELAAASSTTWGRCTCGSSPDSRSMTRG